jgi:VIT1/CCC1 family predicted Fe2+/Mn2+ transporter
MIIKRFFIKKIIINTNNASNFKLVSNLKFSKFKKLLKGNFSRTIILKIGMIDAIEIVSRNVVRIIPKKINNKYFLSSCGKI